MSEPDDTVSMSILLIDDDRDILRTVGSYLEARGHRVQPANNGAEGLDLLKKEIFDIVVTDIKMPRIDGFGVLKEIRRISPGTEVIMATAFGDIETAVHAMREGAFDFFTKPVKMRELTASLNRTVRFHALRLEKDRAQKHLDRIGTEARKHYSLDAIVGESPGVRTVKDMVRQVCKTDHTTVLVCGETGTGKEMIARAIHSESARTSGPFVAVDCSAIPESLVESEFYGHVKGAFTDAREAHRGYFEQADGGTLFLDEIGDMNPGMQAKLLRTLEERRIRPVGGSSEIPVDVRIVSATHRDLSQAVSEGNFREDLYYRLNTFTIRIPSLRERREDILPLAHFFLNRYAREQRKPTQGFTPEAEQQFEEHPFPGNVRELRNRVERAVILCASDRITPDLLQDHTSASRAASLLPSNTLNLASAECSLIREALRQTENNLTRAAEVLGISRDGLRRKLKRHNIQTTDDGPQTAT